MVKANIKDSDNYFHTLAMCEASNAGFPRETIALSGGLVKEVIDLWKKSPYTDNYGVKKISTLDAIKDSGKDMLNNLVGLFLGKIIDDNYTCEEVLKLDKPKGKK